MQSLRCPNQPCPSSEPSNTSGIIRYGFYQTRWGKRRRFLCKRCGRTFGRNSGTLYHRLQHRRTTVDEVATLSVEGVNKSAIARAKQIAWNTVDRWLERAADFCRRFNRQRIKRLQVTELQADETQTFVGCKRQPPIWIFVSIEVWSRLWPSTVVGKRSYRNTLDLFRDLSNRTKGNGVPLITTDGFKFYRTVVKRVFKTACLYGQVIKKRRNDRVIKVERKPRIGTAWRWERAWRNSKDSRKLNTSYVERLNLTMRKGSAYLFRRTICHARRTQRLEDHLELLRCHYNFIRPHLALKFGREIRTPAMQAGLTKRRLTFRDFFTTSLIFLVLRCIMIELVYGAKSVSIKDWRFSSAAYQQSMTEAPGRPYLLQQILMSRHLFKLFISPATAKCFASSVFRSRMASSAQKRFSLPSMRLFENRWFGTSSLGYGSTVQVTA